MPRTKPSADAELPKQSPAGEVYEWELEADWSPVGEDEAHEQRLWRCSNTGQQTIEVRAAAHTAAS